MPCCVMMVVRLVGGSASVCRVMRRFCVSFGRKFSTRRRAPAPRSVAGRGRQNGCFARREASKPYANEAYAPYTLTQRMGHVTGGATWSGACILAQRHDEIQGHGVQTSRGRIDAIPLCLAGWLGAARLWNRVKAGIPMEPTTVAILQADDEQSVGHGARAGCQSGARPRRGRGAAEDAARARPRHAGVGRASPHLWTSVRM